MTVKHGGNLQEISEIYQMDKNKLIDFSANINPLGIPEGVKRVLRQSLDELLNYPDIRYRALKEAIADFHHILPEQVYASNGAAEAIFMLGRVLKIDRLLLLAPTFMEYEAAFNQQETEFFYFNLEQHDFQLEIADLMKQALQQQVSAICLCNPNNPTGQLIQQSELDQLLSFCKEHQLILIIDEAFVDFAKEDNSLVSAIKDDSQLFIFRSLTKMFAIPGLRLGYLLTSNSKILAQMEQLTVPWHINTFADLAGQQALKEQDFIAESQRYIKQERDFLMLGLKKFSDSLQLYPSQTNFIFFRYNGTGCLQEKLIPQGILIRNCNTFNGLENKYYRIAVRTRVENQALLDALEEVLWEK